MNALPSSDAPYGVAIDLMPGLRGVLARNPGPFTHTGTMTHIVGRGRVAIIDPGPDNADHVAAVLRAVQGETVTHILLTHTHRDHAGALQAFHQATGAVIAGCAPYAPSRSLNSGEVNPLDASNDTAYRPDQELGDGDGVTGPDWTLKAVPTPGHTANHLAFELSGTGVLFPGDHVMDWSTTIVAPPDGSMRDYMASLDRLLQRNDRIYMPAHGAPLTDPKNRLATLKAHRLAREAAILNRLGQGDRRISHIVAAVYADLDPRLTPAASLSVLAHIEDLAARGVIRSEGASGIDGFYTLTGPTGSQP